jgi:hypothetical protein
MSAPWTRWNPPEMRGIKPSIKKQYYQILMMREEDNMAKKVEVKAPVKKIPVKLHKQEAEVKKTERVRLEEKKPYIGLVPSTPEWIRCWRKHPELQQEMLVYKNKNFTDVDPELAAKKKAREDELKKIEKFVKKNGVQKRRTSGKGYALEDDGDDDFLEDEEPQPVKKERHMKVVRKEETKKSTKKEVMKTIGKPFGSDGRTFDLYAVRIPDSVKTMSQLKSWLKTEGRTIMEYKDGEIRAYETERVTSTGRVAKVTVKKQGSRNLVTYRSNKNSRTTK